MPTAAAELVAFGQRVRCNKPVVQAQRHGVHDLAGELRVKTPVDMPEGRISGEVAGQEMTEENIMRLASVMDAQAAAF